jgi:hypothetical protein
MNMFTKRDWIAIQAMKGLLHTVNSTIVVPSQAGLIVDSAYEIADAFLRRERAARKADAEKTALDEKAVKEALDAKASDV